MSQESELIRHEPAFRKLFERVAELEMLLSTQISAAEDGSDLASDDLSLDPLRLSSVAAASLMVAIDHLRAVRLVLDSGIPVTAGFTLLRSAVEAAATVVWLLAPPDPLQRATRVLRNQLTDTKDSNATVAVLSGRKGAGTGTEEMLRRKASLLGVNVPLTRVTSSEMFLDIQRVLVDREGAGATDTPVVATWRLLSAAAHGRGHFFDFLLSSEPNTEAVESGVKSTKVWAEPGQFAMILGLTITMTEIAQEIYAERADASMS